jgi:hypothetical protein
VTRDYLTPYQDHEAAQLSVKAEAIGVIWPPLDPDC